jgi:hypothetical protein
MPARAQGREHQAQARHQRSGSTPHPSRRASAHQHCSLSGHNCNAPQFNRLHSRQAGSSQAHAPLSRRYSASRWAWYGGPLTHNKLSACKSADEQRFARKRIRRHGSPFGRRTLQHGYFRRGQGLLRGPHRIVGLWHGACEYNLFHFSNFISRLFRLWKIRVSVFNFTFIRDEIGINSCKSNCVHSLQPCKRNFPA